MRDGKTGFVFFNIEGHLYDYDAAAHLLSIKGGRLLISEELANKLGRPADAGVVVGEISISTTMYPIEVTTVVNGAAQSSVLPREAAGRRVLRNFVPGPDIIVGDLPGWRNMECGTQVGLGSERPPAITETSRCIGFSCRDPDHSVVSQNFYRMSGGANNNDRFEQIGQSWMKHAFFALQDATIAALAALPLPTALISASDVPILTTQV